MADISEIKQVDIGKLKPYENNAKIHGEKQINKLAESIKEFGFISPVLIDKDFTIIAGHGRTQAAKQAGLKKLPCVFVEGLSEEQKKAYILADNRLSEIDARWDLDLVAAEIESLESIEIDLDFELPELPDMGGYIGDERERTFQAYNMNIAADSEVTGDFWQMPIVKCDGYTPSRLIGFNYAKTSKDKKTGVHFFIDDYQFERLWNYPEKYVDILKEYECILTPDFSLYTDMLMPLKIWNTYRSRQLGAYYQKQGIKVIPTISWAEKETYQFCFEGIPKGSIIAVSTVGVIKDKQASEIWVDGMKEAINRIKPSKIILYGTEIDFDFGKIEVVKFQNEVTERWN